MRAQSGQEIQRREDPGRGGLRIAALPALPAVVDEVHPQMRHASFVGIALRKVYKPARDNGRCRLAKFLQIHRMANDRWRACASMTDCYDGRIPFFLYLGPQLGIGFTVGTGLFPVYQLYLWHFFGEPVHHLFEKKITSHEPDVYEVYTVLPFNVSSRGAMVTSRIGGGVPRGLSTETLVSCAQEG